MVDKFKGTGVALVTPFQENGDIDYFGLERVINYVIQNGIDYIVALGSTGEASVLTIEEKHQLLDFTIDVVNKRIPIVAGFSGNDTAKLVRDMSEYHFRGIDAILSATPHYNKPSQEGLYQHFKTLAAHAPVPVILYNVPSRTACNLNAETVIRLANDCVTIIGIKEASNDFLQIMHIIRNMESRNFVIVSGDDALTLPILSVGGHGVISVIGNILPKEFSQMVHAALQNDMSLARYLHYKMLDIIDWLYKEGNPVGIKAALENAEICKKNVRLPLISASEETQLKLASLINNLKNKSLYYVRQ